MIITFLPIIMAVIPAILLVVYFNFWDRKRPEPIGLIWKIFFIGFFLTLLYTLPLSLIYLFLGAIGFPESGFFYAFVTSFILAALFEESLKLFIVRVFIYKNKHFDEVMDGIVYTVTASLGFACLENIEYVMMGGEGWLFIAIVRSFTAVPMHAFMSGIMGYYIGKAKFSKNNEKWNFVKGLMIAVFLHGIYDFVLFYSEGFSNDVAILMSLLIFPILFFALVLIHILIQKALAQDNARLEEAKN